MGNNGTFFDFLRFKYQNIRKIKQFLYRSVSILILHINLKKKFKTPKFKRSNSLLKETLEMGQLSDASLKSRHA